MDVQSYEQLEVDDETLGDARNFLLENQEAVVATHEALATLVFGAHTLAEVEATGELSELLHAPPTFEALVERLMTLDTGERVRVDTRDSSYLGRVKG